MSSSPRILLIEDDSQLATNLGQVLEDGGFTVTHSARGDDGLNRASDMTFDAVLTDLRLPGLGGLELVRLLHEAQPCLPVVLMTAHGTIETAIEATKLGAYDYLQKPFEMEELLALLHKAVDAGRLMREPVALTEAPSVRTALVGVSRAMREVCKEVGRVAAKPVSVLHPGRDWHRQGTHRPRHLPAQRASEVTVPCYQLCRRAREPAGKRTLWSRTWRIHRRRSAPYRARFEQANKGTLLLDEIGDLPPNTQVKLLRVLQQQTFQRVGGSETIAVDVRIIAATHRDLELMIREGKFREDLFHRLNVVAIQLPPLRERPEDIPVLVQHFLCKYAADFGLAMPSINPDVAAVLQAAPWPGNIRELENVTRRLLLEARGLSISVEAVRGILSARSAVRGQAPNSLPSLAATLLARAQRGEISNAHSQIVGEAEREILTQAIVLAEGNQAKAARWLGISRLTLREKLKQLGLHPGADRDSSAVE